jgi:hypothetical protein
VVIRRTEQLYARSDAFYSSIRRRKLSRAVGHPVIEARMRSIFAWLLLWVDGARFSFLECHVGLGRAGWVQFRTPVQIVLVLQYLYLSICIVFVFCILYTVYTDTNLRYSWSVQVLAPL